MLNSRVPARAILGIVVAMFTSYVHSSTKTVFDDLTFEFSGVFKPEMQYGKNISLLNNNNEFDKIWYMRQTLDLNLDIDYGKATRGLSMAEFFFTQRNRVIWGNPNSIATTNRSDVALAGTNFGNHTHGFPRMITWIREAWLKVNLNDFLHLPVDNYHNLTLGAFPFRLGRGIALGDAYAVGPELLGFYTDAVVDQYAFGGRISGVIRKNVLTYDLYAAILQNKSSSISETGEKIYGQEYGRLLTPARGFGKINFLIAAHTIWFVFDDVKAGRLSVEPYALYNSDPEQQIEFRGDATSKLGTIGCAVEYSHPAWEFGFDYAFNLGRQLVKGWDRNQVTLENRGGQVVVVNSHVVSQADTSTKIPFIANSEAQRIINSTAQAQSQNGQVIGTVPGGVGYLPGPVTLVNARNRFSDPYTNKYEGWMFITDLAYWLCPKKVQVAAMAGVASGDTNPNETNRDGTFSGFIGLQEIYSGKRVNSAFFLGGAGKVPRPLAVPQSDQVPSRFAQSISRFTNLIVTGSSIYWEPSNQLNVKSNILAYWQQITTNKFDAVTRRELNEPASNYLGLEQNVFLSYMPYKHTRLFFVWSIFFPGQHYTDIRGIPLSSEQERQLDLVDLTGFTGDRIPNLGDNISYTINLGIEYLF